MKNIDLPEHAANGTFVILSKLNYNNSMQRIILCLIPRIPQNTFVVWTQNKDDLSCILGHYFESLHEALNFYDSKG